MSQGKSPAWVKLTKFGRNDLSPAATSLLGVGCVKWDPLGWGTCKLCPITVTRSQVEMSLGCKRQEVFLKLCLESERVEHPQRESLQSLTEILCLR